MCTSTHNEQQLLERADVCIDLDNRCNEYIVLGVHTSLSVVYTCIYPLTMVSVGYHCGLSVIDVPRLN